MASPHRDHEAGGRGAYRHGAGALAGQRGGRPTRGGQLGFGAGDGRSGLLEASLGEQIPGAQALDAGQVLAGQLELDLGGADIGLQARPALGCARGHQDGDPLLGRDAAPHHGQIVGPYQEPVDRSRDHGGAVGRRLHHRRGQECGRHAPVGRDRDPEADLPLRLLGERDLAGGDLWVLARAVVADGDRAAVPRHAGVAVGVVEEQAVGSQAGRGGFGGEDAGLGERLVSVRLDREAVVLEADRQHAGGGGLVVGDPGDVGVVGEAPARHGRVQLDEQLVAVAPAGDGERGVIRGGVGGLVVSVGVAVAVRRSGAPQEQGQQRVHHRRRSSRAARKAGSSCPVAQDRSRWARRRRRCRSMAAREADSTAAAVWTSSDTEDSPAA